jgi:hypothetical protein
MNRESRKILKKNHIQISGKPLGRPTKEMNTAEYKRQAHADNGIRNGVEAVFGTGKRVYRANNIRAKLPDTGDTWTAMCYLVKNIRKFLKALLFALFGNRLMEHHQRWMRFFFYPFQMRTSIMRIINS